MQTKAQKTEARNQAIEEALPQIEALLALARANFPKPTEVRMETIGSSPRASLSLPWYVLSYICEAARALSKNSGEQG